MKYVLIIVVSSFATLSMVGCGPTVGDKQVAAPPKLDKGALATAASDPNTGKIKAKNSLGTLHPVHP